MKIAILSPIAWRTPPVHYGPWELIASMLTEGLVKKGHDVSLFATANSITQAKLYAITDEGYEENKHIDPKVAECLHISECVERADQFDIIHNHFDFLPLTYSKLIKTPVVTTIHGFSSPKILQVYQKYNKHTHYVAISHANKNPQLNYTATVYHGIDTDQFIYEENPQGDYLLFFGRIHPDKGTADAIHIARAAKKRLIIAGIVQDKNYFERQVKPQLKKGQIEYIGSVRPSQRSELLGNATALLHPIQFEEPFGLSIIEAMACGTPVLAYNKGSMPELIEEGINGFIVENSEQAIEKIKQIESIQRKNCRNTVETKFTKEQMVNNYLQVYEKILASVSNNG